MQQQNNNRVWLANYYHRQRALAIQQLKGLESMGVKPKYKDKKVKEYSFIDYISFLGDRKAAEDWDVSIHTVRSWRYGNRQPSIRQAKEIIKATEGRLNFESFYGSVDDIVKVEE
jgi:hypothetical protein